jgi:hypothetical protein
VFIGTVLSLTLYPDKIAKSFNFKFYSTEVWHLWNIINLFLHNCSDKFSELFLLWF